MEAEATGARGFESVLGSDCFRTPVGDEARAAILIAEPRDAAEVSELVRKCEADTIALAPLGATRTLAQIRRAPVALGVSLARMNRVIDYQPGDMTVIAQAGCTLDALNQLGAASAQRLGADPAGPSLTTLGALVATAGGGPLRLSEGIVRDLLIGVGFVGHSGRAVRGGGRVVKNVAGYDLMKVMTGSFGTLGLITEVTFRMRPLVENYQLAIASYDDAAAAFKAARAAGEAAPLVHLEVTSPAVSASLLVDSSHSPRHAVLAGFAGIRTEIDYQLSRIADALGAGAIILAGAEAISLYERLRDYDLRAATLAAQIAVPPAELTRCVIECVSEFRAHAGCGVAQLFVAGELDVADAQATVARWRAIARAARGHVRLLAARPALRDKLDYFDAPPPPALALMRRLKTAFDPHGIFNPGCFVGGI